MASLISRWRQWLWAQRTSARTAYLFQIVSRIASSPLSLIWNRLLLNAMGKPLLSFFFAAQSVFSLGSAGDFGIGGSIAVHVGEKLGASDANDRELQAFLACARAIFISLAALLFGGVLIAAPFFSHNHQFTETSGIGPPFPLLLMGALSMTAMLVFSYTGSLNYACGNVSWPVLPELLLLHLSFFCHWLLARHHQPLWLQFSPYVISAALRIALTWYYVRLSHPSLSRFLPIRFNRKIALPLFESSFWFYLSSTATLLYRNTDTWVIEGGVVNGKSAFAAGTLADYLYNYKFCELAVFVAVTASFVSLPRITQWLSSPKTEDQQRVRLEIRRLNQFQALFGTGAALAYLVGINLFMKIWWYRSTEAVSVCVLPLQIAFALNMAVTTCSDAGVQLAFRSGMRGRRLVGSVLGLGGLVNLVLSIVAMKHQSLVGIASATVLAQSLVSFIAGYYICRHLKLTWMSWMLKGWLAPFAAIAIAGWLKYYFPPVTIANFCFLALIYLAMLALIAVGLGIDLKSLALENRLFKKLFFR